MPQPVDVVVVIVNYRSAALTLRALESLVAERTRRPQLKVEAMVVENASGDEAVLEREIRARFSDWVTLVVSPTNGGFGAGNNLGLRTAFAGGAPPRHFHFLNPDTETRPGAVNALVEFLDAHPAAGIAGSRIQNEDGSDWPFAFRFPTPLSELERACELGIVSRLLEQHTVSRRMPAEPTQADWVSGASFMVRREVIERVGGFDEEYFLYYEETDLCQRARRSGWEVWYVPDSCVMHMCGQSTGVRAQDEFPTRLPRYCHESRRRYFVKNHGVGYAALADLAFLAGRSVGGLKRILKRQPNPPFLIRDFLKDTVLLPHNLRRVPPSRHFVPDASTGGPR